MPWMGFQSPKRVEIDAESLTSTYGKFVAQPFERGFATTVGNALRRCLLSSIEGAAITGVAIEGVLHEFSSVPGVVEDVTDIILNLKQVPLRLTTEESRTLTLDVAGPATVTARQLAGDSQIEICDPDVHLATLSEEGRLRLQAQVRLGRGYVAAEKNADEAMGIGWVPLDSAHSPVRRVNFRVDTARVGRMTDYEKLTLEVWTNGTVTPERAVSLAATLLADHLGIFVEAAGDTASGEQVSADEELEALLDRKVEDFELSQRNLNCLKNANIHTMRDLVNRSEREMLETKGLGAKSLDELRELLGRYGLSFGMSDGGDGATA